MESKTQSPKSTSVQPIISLLIVGIGIFLMIFKIYEDSEPGAIPLFLTIGGSIWYFIWSRLKRSSKEPTN